MKKMLFVFSGMLFILSDGLAPGLWELKKDENGIKVYTLKSAIRNLKEFRVVCQLYATKAQLIAILQNIRDYSSWVYSNKKSVFIKIINPQKILDYTQSHLPWPIKDRDLIVELDINPAADIVNIQAKSIPD